ncbi:unnamed protein product [Urochloa decumbens]|uniref:Uncharacterized protein n=1 Tax=Urochloa decumbens TaxID=240449 RepID=A0ABC9GST0_9POAL
MAGGGRCRRRRSWISSIRRRGGGSKLSMDGGGIDDIHVKPDNRDRGEWICVRGHRIRRSGRMRVDSNGSVYVPDSEDEEADMEMEEGSVNLANSGGTSVAPDAIAVGGDGVMGDGVDAAAEGIPADAVNFEEDAGTGEEMHPKVAARLKMLLDHIDPTFRDVFVSMLKVGSINIQIYSMHSSLLILVEKMGLFFLDFGW